MVLIFRNRISIVWLLLVLATLVSFESVMIGHGRAARAIVLVITFTKATFVGREFIELRHAPAWMLWLFQAWAAIVCGALVVLFW
ncbi:cytochrome C oxidase subunit IV family protein [Novosphingobium sp.]|uniref:cytochrome C oxidase subunit IV family protein n=1 Tax=Novosphingobium sp. TaxID=1874826 RepID=UPI00352A80BE